jgi:hypothetical protein
LILEDTATWKAASRRLAAAGDLEAAAPPLTVHFASLTDAAGDDPAHAGSPHEHSTPAPTISSAIGNSRASAELEHLA